MGTDRTNKRITIIRGEEYTRLENSILGSAFPFSKRMCNMLEYLEVKTIGELAGIPLKDLQNIRGFKTRCKQELIAFIEFEAIQNLFEGFSHWKGVDKDKPS